MTKLEFINKEIEITKKQLNKYPLNKKQSDPNYKYKEADIQYIHNKFYTERLQILQQIKTDLEAWEVVKKYLFVDKNIFEEDWEEFEYEYIRFINENICPMHGSNFEEIDIIKKALEVEDEKI